MTVYEAIHKMRELTAKSQPFAFSFMTYSTQKHMSHGEVSVEHALLVKNEKRGEDDLNNYMLTYTDQDTGEEVRGPGDNERRKAHHYCGSVPRDETFSRAVPTGQKTTSNHVTSERGFLLLYKWDTHPILYSVQAYKISDTCKV